MSTNLVDLTSGVKTTFDLLDKSRQNPSFVLMGEKDLSPMSGKDINAGFFNYQGQAESRLLKLPQSTESLLRGLVTKNFRVAVDRPRATTLRKNFRKQTKLRHLDTADTRLTPQTGIVEENTASERESIQHEATIHSQEAPNKVNSIKEVINDVYPFSEHDHDQVTQVNLHLCLENCLRFLAHEFNGNVTLITDFSGALPEIIGSTRALNQVILPLLMNAIHAVEGFGNISISTYCEGDSVCFQIEDNGIDLQGQHEEGIVGAGLDDPNGRGTWQARCVPTGGINDLGGQLIVERSQNLWSRCIVKLPRSSASPPVSDPSEFELPLDE